jgi:hypothetical protein
VCRIKQKEIILAKYCSIINIEKPAAPNRIDYSTFITVSPKEKTI